MDEISFFHALIVHLLVAEEDVKSSAQRKVRMNPCQSPDLPIISPISRPSPATFDG